MLSDQDKKQIKQLMQSNRHEVYVVSMDEMDAIMKSSPKSNIIHVQNAWQKFRNKVELGAGYYASADDLRTLGTLIGDLGGFTTKAYVKTYGGKPHIILKGYPGLRKVLTGTKYGIKNPKVVTMGLGKAGAIHAAKSGGIISIVLLSAYRVTDYLLTDNATLSQLIGSLATDVVKVGIATGASIAVASAVGAAFTVAIGPIAAVVIVGVGVSMALSAIDEHYGITSRVISALDELGDDVNGYYAQVARNINREINETADSVIDYAFQYATKLLIDTARHHVNRFLSNVPKVF